MKKLLRACFVLALGLCVASTAWGQAQITSGTVQGDVLDEKGGSVAGATVEAKNLDTNFTQTETTNADGHFAFLSLAPGRYTLTISESGFATVLQQNVNLTVGRSEEHTSELQSQSNLVCRLLLEKKKYLSYCARSTTMY